MALVTAPLFAILVSALVESACAEQFAYLQQYMNGNCSGEGRPGLGMPVGICHKNDWNFRGHYTMVKVQDGLVMQFDYGDDSTCEGKYSSWVPNYPLDVCTPFTTADSTKPYSQRMTLRTDEFMKWTFFEDQNCSNVSTTKYHPLGNCFSFTDEYSDDSSLRGSKILKCKEGQVVLEKYYFTADCTGSFASHALEASVLNTCRAVEYSMESSNVVNKELAINLNLPFGEQGQLISSTCNQISRAIHEGFNLINFALVYLVLFAMIRFSQRC